MFFFFFFFNDTATTEIYTLSLHDALPIFIQSGDTLGSIALKYDTTVEKLLGLNPGVDPNALHPGDARIRSEEHTSELQSLTNLVCRLLLEKKKKRDQDNIA